jgi:hypothetical protein
MTVDEATKPGQPRTLMQVLEQFGAKGRWIAMRLRGRWAALIAGQTGTKASAKPAPGMRLGRELA